MTALLGLLFFCLACFVGQCNGQGGGPSFQLRYPCFICMKSIYLWRISGNNHTFLDADEICDGEEIDVKPSLGRCLSYRNGECELYEQPDAEFFVNNPPPNVHLITEDFDADESLDAVMPPVVIQDTSRHWNLSTAYLPLVRFSPTQGSWQSNAFLKRPIDWKDQNDGKFDNPDSLSLLEESESINSSRANITASQADASSRQSAGQPAASPADTEPHNSKKSRSHSRKVMHFHHVDKVINDRSRMTLEGFARARFSEAFDTVQHFPVIPTETLQNATNSTNKDLFRVKSDSGIASKNVNDPDEGPVRVIDRKKKWCKKIVQAILSNAVFHQVFYQGCTVQYKRGEEYRVVCPLTSACNCMTEESPKETIAYCGNPDEPVGSCVAPGLPEGMQGMQNPSINAPLSTAAPGSPNSSEEPPAAPDRSPENPNAAQEAQAEEANELENLKNLEKIAVLDRLIPQNPPPPPPLVGAAPEPNPPVKVKNRKRNNQQAFL